MMISDNDEMRRFNCILQRKMCGYEWTHVVCNAFMRDFTAVKRRNSDGSTVIVGYTSYMGGTDLADQLKGSLATVTTTSLKRSDFLFTRLTW